MGFLLRGVSRQPEHLQAVVPSTYHGRHALPSDPGRHLAIPSQRQAGAGAAQPHRRQGRARRRQPRPPDRRRQSQCGQRCHGDRSAPRQAASAPATRACRAGGSPSSARGRTRASDARPLARRPQHETRILPLLRRDTTAYSLAWAMHILRSQACPQPYAPPAAPPWRTRGNNPVRSGLRTCRRVGNVPTSLKTTPRYWPRSKPPDPPDRVPYRSADSNRWPGAAIFAHACAPIRPPLFGGGHVSPRAPVAACRSLA
jgi:hypothetical protein